MTVDKTNLYLFNVFKTCIQECKNENFDKSRQIIYVFDENITQFLFHNYVRSR